MQQARPSSTPAHADNRQIDVADPRADLRRLGIAVDQLVRQRTRGRNQSRPAARPRKMPCGGARLGHRVIIERALRFAAGDCAERRDVRSQASCDYLPDSAVSRLPRYLVKQRYSANAQGESHESRIHQATRPAGKHHRRRIPDTRANRPPGARAGRTPPRSTPSTHTSAAARSRWTFRCRLSSAAIWRASWRKSARRQNGSNVGDRVWGSNQGLLGRQGTFAEFAAVDEDWLYPTPTGVSDETAAATALVGITAHLGLVRDAKLQRRRNAVRQRRHRRRGLDGRANVQSTRRARDHDGRQRRKSCSCAASWAPTRRSITRPKTSPARVKECRPGGRQRVVGNLARAELRPDGRAAWRRAAA